MLDGVFRRARELLGDTGEQRMAEAAFEHGSGHRDAAERRARYPACVRASGRRLRTAAEILAEPRDDPDPPSDEELDAFIERSTRRAIGIGIVPEGPALVDTDVASALYREHHYDRRVAPALASVLSLRARPPADSP